MRQGTQGCGPNVDAGAKLDRRGEGQAEYVAAQARVRLHVAEKVDHLASQWEPGQSADRAQTQAVRLRGWHPEE